MAIYHLHLSYIMCALLRSLFVHMYQLKISIAWTFETDNNKLFMETKITFLANIIVGLTVF